MKTLISLLMMSLPALALAEASSPDQSFFDHLAQGGMAEVEIGKLAETQGSSPAVKSFGAMMVRIHAASHEKLQQIAKSKNVKLPDQPSISQMAAKKMLEMKSGASFDKSYIEGQIKAHENTVVLVRKEIASGKDTDAKAFATEILPAVEEHLAKINEIAASEGVKK